VIPIVGGWYQNSSFTENIISESHGFWTDLVSGNVDSGSINYNQTTQSSITKSYVAASQAEARFEIPQANELPAKPKPERYNHWYYLLGKSELIEVPEAKSS